MGRRSRKRVASVERTRDFLIVVGAGAVGAVALLLSTLLQRQGELPSLTIAAVALVVAGLGLLVAATIGGQWRQQSYGRTSDIRILGSAMALALTIGCLAACDLPALLAASILGVVGAITLAVGQAVRAGAATVASSASKVAMLIALLVGTGLMGAAAGGNITAAGIALGILAGLSLGALILLNSQSPSGLTALVLGGFASGLGGLFLTPLGILAAPQLPTGISLGLAAAVASLSGLAIGTLFYVLQFASLRLSMMGIFAFPVALSPGAVFLGAHLFGALGGAVVVAVAAIVWLRTGQAAPVAQATSDDQIGHQEESSKQHRHATAAARSPRRHSHGAASVPLPSENPYASAPTLPVPTFPRTSSETASNTSRATVRINPFEAAASLAVTPRDTAGRTAGAFAAGAAPTPQGVQTDPAAPDGTEHRAAKRGTPSPGPSDHIPDPASTSLAGRRARRHTRFQPDGDVSPTAYEVTRDDDIPPPRLP